jgi:CRP/FNR family transcriptional regulator, cyclic AMP receptor protein
MRSGLNPARSELLRRVPLFTSCTDKELAQVDALVDDVEVEADEALTREGAPGRESFIIVSGLARVTLQGDLVATLGPGDFFGEMALLDRHPRTATVTAVTPMHLLVLDPRAFNRLLEVGSVATVMLKGVVERLRAVESPAPSPADR